VIFLVSDPSACMTGQPSISMGARLWWIRKTG
jgi:hypothetical protein